MRLKLRCRIPFDICLKDDENFVHIRVPNRTYHLHVICCCSADRIVLGNQINVGLFCVKCNLLPKYHNIM